MPTRLSILDLAPIGRGESASDSFAGSVALAQQAEELGYERVWYAEHHNMPSIASSATSVLIAHIGAHTQRIRLGAGGVMLPNHAPLTIAEQFGTLAAMYPGRIDLGLGRAPGSDQNTMYALRRNPGSAEAFPQDVMELQGYLDGHSVVPGVDAVPGKGSRVPLYILGSSLFGATAGRGARPAVRVRVALRAGGAGRGDRRLPERVPALRAARATLRDRRGQRDRRRHHQRRRETAAGHPAQASRQPVRTATRRQRPRHDRRPGRPAPRRRGRSPGGRDAHLHGAGHAATKSRTISTASCATPRPTS